MNKVSKILYVSIVVYKKSHLSYNAPPAPAGEGFLGREFVFVFYSLISFVVHFGSLGLPGFGCWLVALNPTPGKKKPGDGIAFL